MEILPKTWVVAALGLLMLMGTLMGGCATDSGWKTAYELERSARQEQDARLRALETRQQPQQQPQQQQPQPQVRALEDVLQLCDKIQQATDVPISCSIKAAEKGQPTLAFGFRNQAEHDQYWKTLVDELAVAYCARTLQGNLDGYVSAMIFDIRMGQIYSCRQQRFTMPWSYVPPQAGNPTSNRTY
ncbi:MAG: hypothetical protein ACJ788_03235 [Ktedonobacteraceae bacterium]